MAMGEVRMLIDDELVEAASGKRFDNINPSTERVTCLVADADTHATSRAIGAARWAFDDTDWSTNTKLRTRRLQQWQDALASEEKRRQELVLEVGTPLTMTFAAQLDWSLADALLRPLRHIDEEGPSRGDRGPSSTAHVHGTQLSRSSIPRRSQRGSSLALLTGGFFIHSRGRFGKSRAARSCAWPILGIASVLNALSAFGILVPAPVAAEPGSCNDPSCIPGINRVVELGAYCDNTIHFVFATTPDGRVVFCDSARGLPPRYFRSPPVAGIRDYGTACPQPYTQVAQAPDGLFLLCGMYMRPDGEADSRWIRGDNYNNP
jgi:hypothetical protein